MKTKYSLIFFLLVITLQVHAQNSHKPKIYSSGGGELIFSSALVNSDIESVGLRFSAWFHLQNVWHYDFSKKVGVFAGLSVRNIGYISYPKNSNAYVQGYTEYNETTNKFQLKSEYISNQKINKIKRRTYTLAIPIGFKFGDLENNRFIYLGGEIEFPFHYKTKYWLDNEKIKKESEWFSSQTNLFLGAVFLGIQLPGGYNIKLKWYLNDLMNTNYSTSLSNTDGKKIKIKPYQYLQSQMFYISFGMNMFKEKAEYSKTKTNNNIIYKL